MMRGRRDDPSVRYPDLGAVLARELGQAHSQVPDYVTFYTSTEGRDTAPGTSGFLGERYAPMPLTEGNVPHNLRRLESIDEIDHAHRAELRDLMSRRFARGRAIGKELGSAQRRLRAGPRADGQRVAVRHRPGAAGRPRPLRPNPVRRAGPGRPPPDRGRRAVRPRRRAPGGTATARTSRRIRSWSPNSIT